MRKWLMIHVILALSAAPLFSQELQELLGEAHKEKEEEAEPMMEMPMMQAGDASAGSAKAAQSTNWQNWAVAGGALIAAAIGVVIVATNSGSSAQHD